MSSRICATHLAQSTLGEPDERRGRNTIKSAENKTNRFRRRPRS